MQASVALNQHSALFDVYGKKTEDLPSAATKVENLPKPKVENSQNQKQNGIRSCVANTSPQDKEATEFQRGKATSHQTEDNISLDCGSTVMNFQYPTCTGTRNRR